MSSTSTSTTLQEAVAGAFEGRKVVIRCPAHEDDSPSLSVNPGRDQPVLLNCFANCSTADILEAGGMTFADISHELSKTDLPAVNMWTPAGDASHIYPYYDESGTLLYEVLRVDQDNGKKKILQRRPDPDRPGKHLWRLDDTRKVLYRLPYILDAVENGRTIHIAEGEKCVEALMAVIPHGEQATTNPGGAGKWHESYTAALSGARIVVYADSDDPGQNHAREVREALTAAGCTVSIKEPPPGVMLNGKRVNDVADHLEMGRALEDLLETTPESPAEKSRTGFDVLDVINRPAFTYEYVIPGTLAKRERVLLIGLEGRGKSMLMRQWATQVAAGIHPFSLNKVEPKRVLFIDAENQPHQIQSSWRDLVGLCGAHGAPIEPGMLTILEEHESEHDLTSNRGASWLEERVHAYQPDLVLIGPLYNLSDRDLREDDTVRRLKRTINKARDICGSAVIMEHHAPLRSGNDKKREVRPYGSSTFLKWPDFGFGMTPTDDPKVMELTRNRGMRVRGRAWPSGLREGTPNTMEFPWMEHELEA